MFRFIFVTLFITWLVPHFLTWYWTISISEPLEEYDFIIVGAGTSGSVVANRLTEIPNVKVLLLEAGGEHPLNFLKSIPMLSLALQKSNMDWQYVTEPQKYSSGSLSENRSLWPRGKVLGGTSVLNLMVYTRGSPHDYDSWVKLGAKDWDYKSVLPYFKKSEHMASPDLSDSEYHGYDGPLNIDIRKDHGSQDLFVKAGEEIGYKIIDYNSNEDEGFAYVQSTTQNGKRHSAADAFLYPVSSRQNLHILANAHVSQILFDEDKNGKPRATGVKYVRYGKEKIVKAKNEVILSAGAVGTPHLLMLSGIGPKKHLEDNAVKVVADLPGVGSNLQDHVMLPIGVKSDIDISDEVISSKTLSLSTLFSYLYDGSGSLGSCTADGFAFLKTNKNFRDKKFDYPDIAFQMLSAQFDVGNKQLIDFHKHILNIDNETINDIQEQAKKVKLDKLNDLSILVILSHPESMGTIRLKSSNYSIHPVIDPNYLKDSKDVETLVRGIKVLEKMEKSPTFLSYGMKMMFASPKCEKSGPVRSEEFYRCVARRNILTVYHHCCTAKMGARTDKMAVADHRLRVYKVEGLRVADASVMPAVTSGNTQAPCYMIGEKAADMIKEDWNLV
ncbi:L-sorbose 1-dehydrogenase-like isoform X1 [Clavelina lepadiformis]|uniref:L-sorbose 1-dehydrogenase-like isoform X1 n=2 Tax=Clavelina lepadiformis TaxID=159417 RepID=UPI004041A3CB